MLFAFSFLFVIASALCMFAVAWCWFCFKVGCWMMRGFTGRARHESELYQARPQPVVIPQPVVVPPPPQFARDPRLDRAGMCSSRRRHGGGAAVVMTVLAVSLVAFGVRNLVQTRQSSRARAQAAQGPRNLKQRTDNAIARANAILARNDSADAKGDPDLFTGIAGREGQWDVTGLGKTSEDAHQDALDKTSGLVNRYFHEHLPGLKWPISSEFIESRLVDASPPKTREFPEPAGTMTQMNWHVRITPEHQTLVLQQDRRFRMEHRMIWLGQVLAAVMALLATGAAYIRLDEASKGYYTGWLRLGATALVASAGMSLWYFA